MRVHSVRQKFYLRPPASWWAAGGRICLGRFLFPVSHWVGSQRYAQVYFNIVIDMTNWVLLVLLTNYCRPGICVYDSGAAAVEAVGMPSLTKCQFSTQRCFELATKHIDLSEFLYYSASSLQKPRSHGPIHSHCTAFFVWKKLHTCGFYAYALFDTPLSFNKKTWWNCVCSFLLPLYLCSILYLDYPPWVHVYQ